MVLRREDVASRPTHFGTERGQCFDQHSGLNCHVQRSDDPCAFKRLRRPELATQRHQTGHFGFGNIDFFTAKIGLADIGDYIIVESHGLGLR